MGSGYRISGERNINGYIHQIKLDIKKKVINLEIKVQDIEAKT